VVEFPRPGAQSLLYRMQAEQNLHYPSLDARAVRNGVDRSGRPVKLI
jgi:hypothetical protein